MKLEHMYLTASRFTEKIFGELHRAKYGLNVTVPRCWHHFLKHFLLIFARTIFILSFWKYVYEDEVAR